jgi:protein AroM
LKIVEAGALDNLTLQQIESLRPRRGETVYVTRLRDGSEVKIAKERLIPLLNEKTKLLQQQDVEATVVLCSGKLELESRGRIIFPSVILERAVQSLLDERDRLGVLLPEKSQVREGEETWSKFAKDVKALSVSPYGESIESLKRSAKAFRDRDLIVLDCIGYSSHHRKTVRTLAGKPVISARSITFRFLEEIFH